METKQIIVKVLITLLCIAAIGYIVTAKIIQTRQTVSDQRQEETTYTEEVPLPEGAPSFTWELDYTNETEYPQTTLSLNATYENGVVIKKDVDTAQGSCNEYDNRDKDVFKDSQMIICYYAGLGHYYKVVASDTGYNVQRRIFEEGSPDYNPPVLGFETIVTF